MTDDDQGAGERDGDTRERAASDAAVDPYDHVVVEPDVGDEVGVDVAGDDSGDGDADDDRRIPPGTYRVVGVDDDATLLRVADDDGDRVHDGVVHHVDPGTVADLPDGTNPDEGGRRPWLLVLVGAALSFEAVARPVATTLGLPRVAVTTIGVALAALGIYRIYRG